MVRSKFRLHPALTAALLLAGCGAAADEAPCGSGAGARACTFDDDVALVRTRDSQAVVLSDASGRARLLVSPLWQGRVVTSTAAGPTGEGNGWLNRDYVRAGKESPQFNPYGGEDRLWLGPEGSRFALYFKPGAEFSFANWIVPASFDREPFALVERASDRVSLRRDLNLTNYAGTPLSIRLDRTVRLLLPEEVRARTGLALPTGVSHIGYESRNAITNTGRNAWTRETGAPSIWVLGMFDASPSAVIALPLAPAQGTAKVTSDYFGQVPPSRLIEREHVVLMKADGNYRSKLGVPQALARPYLAGYDPARRRLTVVRYDLPDRPATYVNSQWSTEPDPFSGDVANAYNDGPNESGSQLGRFYELESSSPAAFLSPGGTLAHGHETHHFFGDAAALDRVSRTLLNVPLAEIASAFAQPSAQTGKR